MNIQLVCLFHSLTERERLNLELLVSKSICCSYYLTLNTADMVDTSETADTSNLGNSCLGVYRAMASTLLMQCSDTINSYHEYSK